MLVLVGFLDAAVVDNLAGFLGSQVAELYHARGIFAGADGAKLIHRPAHLAHATAEMSDAVVHAADVIEREYGTLDVLVTMHANCGTHPPGLVDTCIERLLSDSSLDSCVSARVVEDCHPYRLKRVTEVGLLKTWVDMPAPSNNRQSIKEKAVVLDGACRAIRVEQCLPPLGQPPFRYLGHRIAWIENRGGLDVHSESDLVLTEHYLASRAGCA